MADTVKSKRQQWKEEDMAAALTAIKQKNMGWKLASKTFNVPSSTLRRRFRLNKGGEKGYLGGRKPTFSKDLEAALITHLKEMEERFFGLTTKDLKRLAFQLAKKMNIHHTFSENTEMAGWKWIQGFLKRNTTISLRTPENTSMARAQAFNKINIAQYFENLSKVMDEYNFLAENIYNVDESGLSTVQSRPAKIFATKGRKQVGMLSSAERGHHLTVVCCMNAVGTFVPPAFIFPRKRFKNELLDNSPPGTTAFCQENGWMSGEIFVKWLKHFVRYAKPNKNNKVLLLLDGHSSHKNLEALEYAKENGIILFCFPAHCTHKVQPLDVGFFGPLQVYYDQEVQMWLKQNPGRPVTHFQVAGIFNKAYLKAATPSNAINAYSKTGIRPLNPSVFEDWMFSPSLTTDREAVTPEPGASLSTDTVVESTPDTDSTETKVSDVQEAITPTPLVLIQQLSPVPIGQPRTKAQKNRKRGKMGILNTTPDIQQKKIEQEEKERKDREKLARKAKRQIKIFEETEEDDDIVEKIPSDNESDAACLYCNELYSMSRPREYWLRCQMCIGWCHAECAGVNPKTKHFICELCK